MRDLIYYNDTGREVRIDQGTDDKVKYNNKSTIPIGAMLKFSYPEEFTPIIKTWDNGGKYGLQIIIMLVDIENLKKTKES